MLDRDPIPFLAGPIPARTAPSPLVVRPIRRSGGGRPSGSLPLVPILGADDPLGPEVERRLTALAHAARGGDRDARDALFAAFGPKLDRMLGRCRGLAWSAAGPRRDGVPWELDDLRQEAYLAFVELLAAWPGDGSVGPYLLAHLPWRLRTAWKRLAAPRRCETRLAASEPALDLLADGSAAAEEARVLLEELAAALPPPDDEIFLLRVRDSLGTADVAERLGLGRHRVDRRWRKLRLRLRQAWREPAATIGRAPLRDAG